MAAEERKYSIPRIIIKGFSFKSEFGYETLQEIVGLARELESRRCLYHIDERTSDYEYQRRNLSELELLLQKQSTKKIKK